MNSKEPQQDHHKITTDQADLARKNARAGLMVVLVVAGMTGLSFAAVPLYNLFCRTTGFGGTTQVADALPDYVSDRRVTVRFNADTGRGMPWDFRPEMREITVNLGERGITSFYAHNRSNRPVVGTALYNVTPLKVGKYFHKIQCFCFGEQLLQPGQSVDMPVLFFVDPEIEKDPNMNDVKSITLSYTFYETDSKTLESAMEAFYNQDNGAISGTN